MTESQLSRIQKGWEAIAKEPLRVEDIKGTAYGFTSELGALRLLAHYTTGGQFHNSHIKAGYSENLKTWYFRLETSSPEVINW